MLADDKDNNRLEMLLSVAILILIYFIVVQTFFQSRKSTSSSKNHLRSSSDGKPSSEFARGSMFMNMIEEMFDLDLEKKQLLFEKQMHDGISNGNLEESKDNVSDY